jgi:protein arginine N-methyltransferase 1
MTSHRQYPDRGIIPLPYHHSMLSDTRRCQAFAGAIEKIVRRGDIVLDLGTGTGLLAYFAARQGAQQVYALEADPLVATATRGYIRRNGLDQKIQLIERRAEDFLPQVQVDVVICEMLSAGLLGEQQVPVLNAIRARLRESQSGHSYRVIPGEVVHYCQLVHAEFDFYGYQVSMIRLGDAYSADSSITVLSEITRYATADFTREVDPVVHSTVEVTATASGTINAIRLLTQAVLWFDQDQPPGEQFIDWFLNFLVVPLENEVPVEVGKAVQVHLNYPYGGALDELRIGVSDKRGHALL